MIFRSKNTVETGQRTEANAKPTDTGPLGASAKALPDAAGAVAGAQTRTAGASPSSDEQQRRAAAAIRHSVAFAQIVSLLMRSPHYKHYTLGDLEWLMLPPLISGQFSIAEAKAAPDGPSMPVAVAFWASVSAEVDKRLSDNVNAPFRLRPDEWRSGDILWLVEATGDNRVIPQLLKQLGETVFKGREVKMRGRGADGKVAPTVLKGAA